MKKVVIIFILIIAFFFRIYGLNWDESHHLHPDERFLTMVVSAVKLPSSIKNYFDPNLSTLNPYNNDFNFYVYGTFPLLIARFIGEISKNTGYDQIFMVGRWLSVFADTATAFLVYLISRQLFKKRVLALLSLLIYSLAVFPIQQAHFFTVDSVTVFFSTLTLLLTLIFLKTKNIWSIISAGFFFGLTLANKTSIGITLPIFLFTVALPKSLPKNKTDWKIIFKEAFIYLLIFLFFAVLAFRIFQPYAFAGFFSLSKHFLQNINDARKMITGDYDYPPNVQWSYTKPLIHPFINIFLWGLGPVISITAIAGSLLILKKYLKKNLPAALLLFGFGSVIFVYQGIQLAKYMRYFYPIYPLLAIFAGYAINQIFEVLKNKKMACLISGTLLLLSLVWTISFISIYGQSHSRIKASEWIYDNIPSGSKITSEEWDDGLPLDLINYHNSYKNISFGLYNPESLEKWEKITQQLNETDYIVMSSNRLFGSIPRLPLRYPVASLYYQLLFKEKLGFKIVAEITSRPCLNLIFLPKVCINDDNSEESFTVYDHPKIFIFKKEKNFSPKLLNPLLDQNLINQAKYVNPQETNKLFFKRLFWYCPVRFFLPK